MCAANRRALNQMAVLPSTRKVERNQTCYCCPLNACHHLSNVVKRYLKLLKVCQGNVWIFVCAFMSQTHTFEVIICDCVSEVS